MLDSTTAALTALLRCDPSITPEQIRACVDLLKGKSSAATTTEPPDRVLSRHETAERLGVTPRTVSVYASRGIIRPLRFGAQSRRASGFSERSVNAALAAARG